MPQNVLWFLLLLPRAEPAAQSGGQKPTAAVFQLAAEHGVTEGVARLLTESLVNEVRASGAFSQVTSSRELEDMVGLERQRQLMNCDSNSCMAEIAGVLGSEFVVLGNIGRLGDEYLLTLKLLQVRSAKVAASVSQRVPAVSETAPLNEMPGAVRRLLSDAHLIAAEAVSGLAAQPATPPGGGPRLSLLALTGAGLGLGGVMALVALATFAAAAATIVVPYFLVPVRTPFLTGDQRDAFFPIVASTVAAGGTLFLLVSMALQGVGLGAAILGVQG